MPERQVGVNMANPGDCLYIVAKYRVTSCLRQSVFYGTLIVLAAVTDISRLFGIDADFINESIIFVCLISLIRPLAHCIDRRGILVINHAGIFDRRLTDTPLPWEDISSIELRRSPIIGSSCIIWVRDPERHIVNALKRLAHKLRTIPLKGWMLLDIRDLDVSIDSLEQALQESPAEKVLR